MKLASPNTELSKTAALTCTALAIVVQIGLFLDKYSGTSLAEFTIGESTCMTIGLLFGVGINAGFYWLVWLLSHVAWNTIKQLWTVNPTNSQTKRQIK